MTSSIEGHVLVIGAANLDIKGRPEGALLPHTANPGRVDIAPGGVGRNIAENLARLQVPTTLITAFGADPFGRMIRRATEEAGVNIEPAIEVEGISTSLFMAFMNRRGDLAMALSDMSILSRLTPQVIVERRHLFKGAEYVVLDADVPADTIDLCLDLAKQHGAKVCIETVSEAKATNISGFLPRIDIITPNRDEAGVLVGFSPEGFEGVTRAADELLRLGVGMVVMTLGAEGVYLATALDKRFIPSISTVVQDTVGAGDALVAGTLYGLIRGFAPSRAVWSGIAAATLTVMTRETVSPDLSPEALERLVQTRVGQGEAQEPA